MESVGGYCLAKIVCKPILFHPNQIGNHILAKMVPEFSTILLHFGLKCLLIMVTSLSLFVVLNVQSGSLIMTPRGPKKITIEGLHIK